jgi:NAD(P)H dehydrogenase (quinone)
MTDSSPTYLITGAAGKLGRGVLKLLLDEYEIPGSRLIAVTRDPSKLAEFAQRGVKVRAGDFEKPETLPAAFAGADRMLMISTDAVDRPGRRLAQHRNAVQAAAAAGVRHVVYTSMISPDADSPVKAFATDHRGTEEALAASGLDYTVLRMMWYMEGLVGKLAPVLKSGKWVTAAAQGRNAEIAHADCVRAAAAALVAKTAGHRTLDMTGPGTQSVEEIATAVSAVTGKPIEVVHVTPEQLEEGLKGAGLPGFVVDIVSGMERNTRAGRGERVSTDFESLTGRKPQSFGDWLAANAKAFTG